MNIEGKNNHVLFTGVSKEKMQEVKAFLKQPDRSFVPCLVSFCKRDEKILEGLLENCENVFQENLITRAYVNTKVFNEILKSCKLSPSRGIVKNAKKCISLIKNKDFHGIVQNLSNFPTLSDVSCQQEINGNIDMNFFLMGEGDLSLQKGINDYLSPNNPFGLKVYTSGLMLPTNKTTTDTRVSIIQGDYDLDTCLTSIKYAPKEKML